MNPKTPSLGQAIATIHRDREWWRKVLIGGLISLTVVGHPIVEGYQLESIDNSQSGYPTPLPRWHDLGTKAVQGLFALVIDFFYFIFPVVAGGLVLLCATLGLSITGGTAALQPVSAAVGLLLAVWLVAVWLLSVSPVGKRLFVGEGQPNQALSSKVLRSAVAPEARDLYLRARLLTLPVYLLPLPLLAAAWWASDRSGWLALPLVWLGLSALLYARLVAVQLYDAAARGVQQRRFEMFRARTRA